MFMSGFADSLVGPRSGIQRIDESHARKTHRHTVDTIVQGGDSLPTSPEGSGSSSVKLSSTGMVSDPHHNRVPDALVASDWDDVAATLSGSTQDPKDGVVPSDVSSLSSDEKSTHERLLYSR